MNTRILLKLSGDFFSSESESFNSDKIYALSKAIYDFKSQCNVELAIVVGAGNVWRFRDNQHLDMSRNISDKLGMSATNFNAVLLAEMLNNCGDKAAALSCYAPGDLMVPYNSEDALNLLDMGHTIVLGGGTGHPYSTTDLASVLRALELDCNIVYKKPAEACPLNLAPTSSTTISLVIGDCIAMALLELKGFKSSQFKNIHPGGNLGNDLKKVSDIMHTGKSLPLAREKDSPLSKFENHILGHHFSLLQNQLHCKLTFQCCCVRQSYIQIFCN